MYKKFPWMIAVIAVILLLAGESSLAQTATVTATVQPVFQFTMADQSISLTLDPEGGPKTGQFTYTVKSNRIYSIKVASENEGKLMTWDNSNLYAGGMKLAFPLNLTDTQSHAKLQLTGAGTGDPQVWFSNGAKGGLKSVTVTAEQIPTWNDEPSDKYRMVITMIGGPNI